MSSLIGPGKSLYAMITATRPMTLLRTLLWFVVAAAAMFAAVWLAERPGTVTAEWHGWRLDTSVGVLLIAIGVLILLALVLYQAPELLARFLLP